MSIFSRLFNKNADGEDKEPAPEEEASPEVEQGVSSRKPPSPAAAVTSAEPKPATKRPPAPSFDMSPSAAAATAAPADAAPTPAAHARSASRHASASSRTLPYVSPTVETTPSTPEPRASVTRSKVTTARQGTATSEPTAPPARPRAPVPSAAGVASHALGGTPQATGTAPQGRSRAHEGGSNAGPPPLPPPIGTASKSRSAETALHVASPDVARHKGQPMGRPKMAGEGALINGAARAPGPTASIASATIVGFAAPVAPAGAVALTTSAISAASGATDPTHQPLTLEFASGPRQKAPPAIPALPSTQVTPAPIAPELVEPAPIAPALPPLETGVSRWPELDGPELQSDLDAAFGAMVEPPRAGATAKQAVPALSSIAEVRELFTALAANHMRQVRDFMIGLNWGEAPREALVVCEAATQSLLRAAREMELMELCAGLDGYAETLKRIASSDAVAYAGSARDELIAAYAKLAQQMPSVFALDGERGQREAIIVHALLQQVPDVRKVTIDKIYAAGLTSLDVLFSARPDEIAATTGISEILAQRIAEQFRRYRDDAKLLSDTRHDAEKKRLAELFGLLCEAHEKYEASADGWSDEAQAEKKESRQARIDVLLQIKVILARLGEVERLSELERLPFQRKIGELEKYLRDNKVELRSRS